MVFYIFSYNVIALIGIKLKTTRFLFNFIIVNIWQYDNNNNNILNAKPIKSITADNIIIVVIIHIYIIYIGTCTLYIVHRDRKQMH